MSRVGGGPPHSRGGGVAPCPLCLRPCMIHRPTYIHRYVNTLLSVSVILLHFPAHLNLQIHIHIFFVCLPSFHSHPSQCPSTKRPHPHRFSQQSEPFGVSARGLSQPKFGQQRRLTSLRLYRELFLVSPGVPRKTREHSILAR